MAYANNKELQQTDKENTNNPKIVKDSEQTWIVTKETIQMINNTCKKLVNYTSQ